MAVENFPEYDADDAFDLWYQVRCRKISPIALPDELKIAVVILKFDPSATRVDYPSMASTITSHAKIDDVDLIFDGMTPISKVGKHIQLDIHAHMHQEND